MNRLLKQWLVLALIAPCFVACNSAPATPDVGQQMGQRMFTLVNLHPDPINQTLSTLNYQQAGFIPAGSAVTIESRGHRTMSFTREDTGVTYSIEHSKHTPSSLGESLLQIFGTQEQISDTSGMSQVDRDGIQQGIAMIGMSKAAIFVACGPPPAHATPTTDMAVWTYWKSRWARRVIEFDQSGAVKRIEG